MNLGFLFLLALPNADDSPQHPDEIAKEDPHFNLAAIKYT
jgi:hypothetical protein